VSLREEEIFGSLTPREFDVLACVARGMKNAEIAEELCMSTATAKQHVRSLLAKMDCRDRVALVIKACKLGFAHADQ
jgi:DNA-binding NarL/FixJ family response regulator